MSDSSDGSGDSEPRSPLLALVSQPKPPLPAADGAAELSDPESDWDSESISSPRLPVTESKSPVLGSDGESLLEFLSSNSTSELYLDLRNVSEDGSDGLTGSPGPEGLHLNQKNGLRENWNTEASGSSDEDLSSDPGSEVAAFPDRSARERATRARHTPMDDDATRRQDKDEAWEPDKAHEKKRKPELGQDEGQEPEGTASDQQSTRSGSAPGSASVSSSAPSEFCMLLLERLGHMEQRTAAVEAQAELGLFLAEVELTAAVETLQDTLAGVQAQLKLAFKGRARDARVEALAADVRNLSQRLLPDSSLSSDGPEVNMVRGLDAVCLVVTVSFALAVMLMWVVYPML